MREKIEFSSIEKKVNELTPDWIVSTSHLSQLPKPVSEWSLSLKFNNKGVKKGSLGHDGKWRDFNTSTATPDFVILDEKRFKIFQSVMNRFFSGEVVRDPFRYLGCKSGYYIEAFGEYYHSGDFVQGLSKKEHEEEVTKAYQSCNAEVLILWEEDILKKWQEVCVPALSKFLLTIDNLPNNYEDISSLQLNEKTIFCLGDTSYWQGLSLEDKSSCVDDLVLKYKSIDVPKPDFYMAKEDFYKFLNWSKNKSQKGTRFGINCCKYFCDSFYDAKVKNQMSLRELWQNEDVMRKAILWQLENESGTHHANRFLNAMSFQSGFRTISILSPSLIVKWIQKYYTGELKGGVFYDPCAGWGSRMLAAHALGMEYVAIDANKQLVQELNNMSEVLNIDATIIYGDSSDSKLVRELLKEKKIDICFSSPPYFDKEIYSKDCKQSINLYPEKQKWLDDFFVLMVNNTFEYMRDDGMVFFNLPKDFNLEYIRQIMKGFSFIDIDVFMESARKRVKERLLFVNNCSEEEIKYGKEYVVCELCSRRFKRLGRHLRAAHNITSEEYQNKFPDKPIICEEESNRVGIDNKKTQTGKKYKKKVAYRLPDGSYVRKKSAWKKAWETENPPPETIMDASKVDLDPWKDKEEGIDYVVCKMCGFKGSNIKRHIKKEHGLEGYSGPLKSQKCKDNLSRAANKTWKTRKSS